MYFILKKKPGVFVKHECPGGNKITKKNIFFSIKVTVKFTLPLTLVSFERVLIVEYACQI